MKDYTGHLVINLNEICAKRKTRAKQHFGLGTTDSVVVLCTTDAHELFLKHVTNRSLHPSVYFPSIKRDHRRIDEALVIRCRGVLIAMRTSLRPLPVIRQGQERKKKDRERERTLKKVKLQACLLFPHFSSESHCADNNIRYSNLLLV